MTLLQTEAGPGNQIEPLARSADIVTTETSDELLLYDQRRHHIHHLNSTSAAIWRLADGLRTVDRLAIDASSSLGHVVDREIVRMALTKLDEAGLLERPFYEPLRVQRASRRDVLRRAATSAAVAMPVIASMTAPTAAQMNSQDPPPRYCVDEGEACSYSEQCCDRGSECGFFAGLPSDQTRCHQVCVPMGGRCAHVSECCAGANQCTTHVDGGELPNAVCHFYCIPVGQPCSMGSSDCCGGSYCDDWGTQTCIPS